MVGSGRSPHTLSRAAAVSSRGHRVRVVTLGEVLPEASVEVSTRPLPTGPLSALDAARGFWRDVRSPEPDLLHLHYAGGRLGTLAALAGVRPLVVTVMGGDVLPEQHLGGHGTLERRATRRILEQADAILAKADRLHSAIVACGGAPDKIETVRWGVDPDRFLPTPRGAESLRRRLSLPAESRLLLSSRILQPLYNVHTIVEAMPRVLRLEPRAMLLVSEDREDADYRSAIERRVASLGIGAAVRFIERLPPAEMPALYSLAEVVVSVPSSDGLPQTLFESMACETPVVLGRLPAYSEVVDEGKTAVFTDIEPAALAGAISRVLGSPELGRDVGRAARRRVLEVASLPRELDRVEACYRVALSRPRTRRVRPVSTALDLMGLALR